MLFSTFPDSPSWARGPHGGPTSAWASPLHSLILTAVGFSPTRCGLPELACSLPHPQSHIVGAQECVEWVLRPWPDRPIQPQRHPAHS